MSARLADAQGFDVVITSAGVSVGERDFVKAALEEQGVEMNFWRVAIKPGKPLAVGRRGATLYFGLPGNPTSSLVTFELFVRPVLRRLLGHSDVEPPRVSGRLEGELRKAAGPGPLRPCSSHLARRRAVGPPARHPDVGRAALGGLGHPPAPLPSRGHQPGSWSACRPLARLLGSLRNERVDTASIF